MKKLLLGSAAAALMIAPAAAVDLTVGGYHNTLFYVSQDYDNLPNASTMNIDQDAEIIFSGKGMLDNGMEVGLNVQLESHAVTDQIDEHYIYVKGGFGKVTIGSENSSARMLEAGHNGYLGYSQIEDNFLVGLGVGYTQSVHTSLTGDAPKLSYMSPKFSGLQVGYSLTPSAGGANNGGTAFGIEDENEGTSYGVRYSGNVGPAMVSVSIGAEEVDNATSDEDSSTSLKVGMNGVTLTYHALNRTVANAETDYVNTAISYKVSDKLMVGLDMQTDETAAGATVWEHTRIGGSYALGDGAKLTFSNTTGEDGTDEGSYTAVGLLLKF